MDIARIADAPDFTDHFVAVSLVETETSSMRVIRLAPGQELPPHRHGISDLLLLVVEGTATLTTPEGDVELETGAVAVLEGGEELRAANRGEPGLTLIAFLSPPFPPRAT